MSKILCFIVKVITLGLIDLVKQEVKRREEVNENGQETSDESQKK